MLETESTNPSEADHEELLATLGGPLEIYAERILRVIPKAGGRPQPLIFNKAQRFVDQRLNAQMEEKKRIRALILKGRQQGISTYVLGRYFRKQHVLEGINVYILSHESESTKTLFNTVKRYYNNLPEGIKPEVGRAGAREMTFPGMDCSYSVATAGAKETGRSKTAQLFHGSEVAFWPNAASHLAGAMNIISDEPGTEIILESTANGIGGVFHEMWLKAEAGIGDFIAIFVPWFWQDEYRTEPPVGWYPKEEEQEYAELHLIDPTTGKVDLARAFWMHNKNIVLGGQPGSINWKFRQEYPADAQEAFQNSGGSGLIKPMKITQARKSALMPSDEDARTLGVDVARNVGNGDATHFIDRCGRTAGKLVNESLYTDDTMVIVGKILVLHQEHDFDRIFIDLTGVGTGVYDRLLELGWGHMVTGVIVGEESLFPKKYRNKKAELWDACKNWFELRGGVAIVNDDVLARHLAGPGYEHTSSGQLQVETKKSIRKRLGFSPDRADALVLTFAEHVSSRRVRAMRASTHRTREKRRSYMAA